MFGEGSRRRRFSSLIGRHRQHGLFLRKPICNLGDGNAARDVGCGITINISPAGILRDGRLFRLFMLGGGRDSLR